VQLFVQRARAVQRNFTLNDANAPAVAELCVRLDGLPLAIELAAARVKVFEPGAILSRLRSRLAPARLKLLSGGPRDLPARQQALRNTIDWSFDLLSPQEQALFCRLSVFAGGWTIEAAETVGEDADVLDGLIALLDMNLIRKATAEDDEPRFTMLESIGEYALEKLAARGEVHAVSSKHAHYYLYLAQEAEPAIKQARQEGWLRRLEVEHNNFRSALRWTQTAAGEVRTHLQLAGALWWFWYLHGYGTEGRGWLDAALKLPEAQADSMDRAIVLNGAGLLASEQGDQATAQSRLEACLSLARRFGDRRREAYALHHLGLVARRQNDPPTARSFQAESALIFEEIGDQWGSAAATYELGAGALSQGDLPASKAHFEQSRVLFQNAGDNWGLGLALEGLAQVALQEGDLDAERALLEEGLRRMRALGDIRTISTMLMLLGEVRRAQGEPQQAAGLLQESLALFRELGAEPGDGLPRRLYSLGQAVLQGRDYARAAALFEECLAASVESRQTDKIDLCLVGLAGIAVGVGLPDHAARLLGNAGTRLEAAAYNLSAADQADYERVAAATRRALKPATYAAAYAEGAAQLPEAAIAETHDVARWAREALAATPDDRTARRTPGADGKLYLPNPLTRRELEVIRLVADGLTDAQIAERLVLSTRSVHKYLFSAYSKLDVHSRTAAVRAVQQLGLL
jgi:DNA-binding NarL/FixJ family response regulator